nr:uncharacterized protein LOC113802722 [Penaeus vannamei]
MKTLEENEIGFERDDVSGVIRCTVCDVTVNSPQLLATHIAGNKHKKGSQTCIRGRWCPPPKKSCSGSGVTGQSAPLSSNGGMDDTAYPNGNSAVRKSLDADLEIPECVTKLEETKGGGKYLCNPCQAHCNSGQN